MIIPIQFAHTLKYSNLSTVLFSLNALPAVAVVCGSIGVAGLSEWEAMFKCVGMGCDWCVTDKKIRNNDLISWLSAIVVAVAVVVVVAIAVVVGLVVVWACFRQIHVDISCSDSSVTSAAVSLGVRTLRMIRWNRMNLTPRGGTGSPRQQRPESR